MDSYTLYRIFKNFKIKETDKDQPISSTNIIIYAGDSHAYIYRKFLESIGFINKEKVGLFSVNFSDTNNKFITENLSIRCLDMNGDGINKITQPLFSFV